MRTKAFSITVAAALVVGSVLVRALPAEGRDLVRTDGNDTKGPLDLASVRLIDRGDTDRLQLKTLTKFTAAQLDGRKGWVEVDFSTNENDKAEYFVVVFYHNGNLIALEGKGSTLLHKVPSRRVDRRTVSFDIKHKQLGDPLSYAFYAVSIWRASPCSKNNPCVDFIPNRLPLLLHDYTAPPIHWVQFPKLSSESSASLTFPIRFNAKDDPLGSGTKSWTFQMRVVGTTSWTKVRSGTDPTSQVRLTGSEGDAYEVRLIAVDKQGNKRVTRPKQVVVPYDDLNAMFAYGGTTASGSIFKPYLGSFTIMAQNATATVVPPAASDLCFVLMTAGTTDGSSASVAVDGVPVATLSETESTPSRKTRCIGAAVNGSQTVVVTTTSVDDFYLDGMAVMP